MKSRLTLGIIGCTLLTFLTPNITHAQNIDVGTNRQPRTCPSTSAPTSGRISAAQAVKYIACQEEGDRKVKTGGTVYFIDILSLQVDPKPREVTLADVHRYGETIDREKPIYNLQGSVVAYICRGLGNIYQRGQNCTVTRIPQASGRCFKSPDGNWDCAIQTVTLGTSERHLPPPN